MTSLSAVFVVQSAPSHTPATNDSFMAPGAVTTPLSTDTVGNAAANSPQALQPTGVRPGAHGRRVVDRDLLKNGKRPLASHPAKRSANTKRQPPQDTVQAVCP